MTQKKKQSKKNVRKISTSDLRTISIDLLSISNQLEIMKGNLLCLRDYLSDIIEEE
jgi:hypothetical protein